MGLLLKLTYISTSCEVNPSHWSCDSIHLAGSVHTHAPLERVQCFNICLKDIGTPSAALHRTGTIGFSSQNRQWCDKRWCFLCYQLEQDVEATIEMPICGWFQTLWRLYNIAGIINFHFSNGCSYGYDLCQWAAWKLRYTTNQIKSICAWIVQWVPSDYSARLLRIFFIIYMVGHDFETYRPPFYILKKYVFVVCRFALLFSLTTNQCIYIKWLLTLKITARY